jgi:uncharacterized protein YceH (UPF0502 family)
MEPVPADEIRILGCLVEKERTVPDTYPLTLNSLTAACNQTSNRDPVVSYDSHEVQAALDSLRGKGLTRIVHSPSNRAPKFRHVLEEQWNLDDETIAVLAVLLLRGPQTINELRTRTERYSPGIEDVDAALNRLASREDPLVIRMERRPGQREERWMHLVAGEVTDESPLAETSKVVTSSIADRVAALEARVARLEELLE